MSLFHSNSANAPHLDQTSPLAAMPGGELEVRGAHLDPQENRLPHASIGDISAQVLLSRADRAIVSVPEGSISGNLVLRRNDEISNALAVRIAVPMAENIHPVANPVVDANGQVFTTLSGSRGQSTPVSIFRIHRDFQMVPFVRDLMNPTGLAFDREGYLYASSRAEGTVYRISTEGEISPYAEGMGVATGIAFDEGGNLYVGDRSGTIFKINPDREIFVFATLEPSIAAYHLAFNAVGTLFVTGPTTSSNQAVYAIDRDGNLSTFFQGLGRAQGLAFDVDDNLYVAASLRGQRGIVRITPDREASLVVSGNNLVGLAFVEDGCAVLATRDALYHVALDIEGRSLIG
ncbi:SMP-30/gluconolactonase/LRE family protein [Edaphobacter albus]|uniref:SMP-30/gluconolactonase/LRE family protein n=1 Tax=Edaphobacter sp. 4G125 TaxID=2763071 RepID=UPI0016461533|nr:gluconolaconase [Edaphobacter sp. 4G125]QNI36324.1 gluconolaconase [Edaphobacter sp. 4G125]